MKTHTVITSSILSAFMLAVLACVGGSQPLPDINATAEAMAKVMVEATAQAAPVATPVPPTATPVPPTATPVPPTAPPVPPPATPVPPTATPVPTSRLEYFDNTLYYLPSVTQQEAERLFDYLVQTELFDSENNIEMQLREEEGAYEVRMAFKAGIDPNDTDIKEGLSFTACAVESDVFTNSSVHWIVVGDSFDDIKKRLCVCDHLDVFLPSVHRRSSDL